MTNDNTDAPNVVPLPVAPPVYLRPTQPPKARGDKGVPGPNALAKLQAMEEYRAGARVVRNAEAVEQVRALGQGQRTGMFSAYRHWWDWLP